MKPPKQKPIGRRAFARIALSTVAFGLVRRSEGGNLAPVLEAGQGVVDITPPLGIEMGGFHKTPGNERRIEGIRQPSSVRALVLRVGPEQCAIVSIDILGVSAAFSQRVSQRVQSETGIPADRVRLCATHTHSMPTLRFLLQWGAIPSEFETVVANAIVESIRGARGDLGLAKMFVGKATANGANFNRTTKDYKTEAEFTAMSTDDIRWLDRELQVLRFDRPEKKDSLLWYHFSAHPVCYTDTQSGPDWPALVAEKIESELGVIPSFLQGHAGDVNPGDGEPWLGVPDKVAERVTAAILEAHRNAVEVSVPDLPLVSERIPIPLDRRRLEQEIELYRTDPSRCASGEWVDSGFSKAWFERATTWDLNRESLEVQVSTLRLGEVGLLFHPSELFSFYGLWIRARSPFRNTLLVGYTDGLIGYLTDPSSYQKREYGALVVPKILGLPPFGEDAARTFSTECLELLERATG